MSPGPRRIPDVLLEQHLASVLEGEARARVEALLAESEADRTRLEELRAHSEALLRTHPALEGALRTRLEAALVQSQADRVQREPPRAWSERTLETKQRQRGSWWEVLTSVALAGGLATFLTWVSNPEVDPAPGTHALPSQATAPSAAASLESEAPPDRSPPKVVTSPPPANPDPPTPPSTKPSKPSGPRAAKPPPVVAAPVGKGTVVFRVRPYATVILSGRNLGQTPFDPIETPAGKYTVQFVNDDLKKKITQAFELKPGETKTIKINLEE